MNFAVISDTHLGDKDCGLVIKNKNKDKYELGKFYEYFYKGMKASCDYMILLGDTFDFAIEDYSDAYEAGKVFLNKVVEDGFVRKGFIYIPGNHDFNLWPLIEYEANIINRLKDGQKVRKFQNSLPAIIDARSGNAKFSLYGVKPHENNGNYEYGGMYLDNLIDKKEITFNIAYPNLYLFTKKETVLFTHGHYLDTYWSLFSNYAGELTKKINKNESPDFISLDVNNMSEMVDINLPLNQLASSGVGQSGKLGKIVNKVEHNLKNNKIGRVDVYIINLFRLLENSILKSWPDLLRKLLFKMLKKKSIEAITEVFNNYNTPRDNKAFLKENIKRLEKFYNLTVKELKSLKFSDDENKYLEYQLEKEYIEPNKIIYGHTHVPRGCGESEVIKINNKKIYTYNLGGWLSKDKKNWRGAEIFFINDKGELSSERVKERGCNT